MILRKPYAFLIKYFKIIHLVLSALLLYVSIKMFSIFSFFNGYVSDGITGNNFATQYINLFIYIAILLVIGIAITIYVLFKKKDKPNKYYVFAIIYYVLLFVYTTIVFSALSNLETTEMATRTVRAYRDISLMVFLPGIYFLVIALIRGIGFDIKKFNFSKDEAELEIEEQDNEEVEVRVKIPGYKIKRKIRRFFRELKYYIVENKILSVAVLGIVVIIIGTIIIINKKVYSTVYKEDQAFSLTGWRLNIMESNLTPFDYAGRELNNGKYYLTFLMEATNLINESQSFTISDFRLLINNQYVFPTTSKNEYFIDLGTPYLQQKVKPGETKKYLFIYEINASDVTDSYTLRIEDQVSFLDGNLVAKYKETILTPKVINEIEEVSDYILEEKIPLNYTSLDKSSVTLSNYEIKKSYRYNYKFCITNTKCYTSTDVIDATYQTETNKTLLLFDYKLTLDENAAYTSNIKNFNTFFINFLSLKYKVGTKEYLYRPTNKSTTNLPNKLVLEVNENIKEATRIELILTIRNQRYTIKVK